MRFKVTPLRFSRAQRQNTSFFCFQFFFFRNRKILHKETCREDISEVPVSRKRLFNTKVIESQKTTMYLFSGGILSFFFAV